jgi:hypothetical protein
MSTTRKAPTAEQSKPLGGRFRKPTNKPTGGLLFKGGELRRYAQRRVEQGLRADGLGRLVRPGVATGDDASEAKP